jgi:hypothetical protein
VAAEAPAPAPAPEPEPEAETPTALAPAEEEAGVDDAAAENAPAMRYARLIATDIRLYNEDAVVAGQKSGDLGTRLGEHLKRGKDTFVRRYGEMGPEGLEILHEAYVQVLAGGNADLLSASNY